MKKIVSYLNLFRQEIIVLFLAMGHKDTPAAVRASVVAALLYLVSPVDLVSDFLPVAGMVDDVVVLPAVFSLALRFLPDNVQRDCERRADKVARSMPYILVFLSVLLLGWLCLLVYIIFKLLS